MSDPDSVFSLKSNPDPVFPGRSDLDPDQLQPDLQRWFLPGLQSEILELSPALVSSDFVDTRQT